MQLYLYLIVCLTVFKHQDCQSTEAEDRFQLIQELIQKLQTPGIKDVDETGLRKALLLLKAHEKPQKPKYPIVVNTWPMVNATAKAWDNLLRYDDAVAAVVNGCSECEQERCGFTVGNN